MKSLILALSLLSMSAHAGTAFYSHETTPGMNKICYYSYMGSSIAITLSANRLCPLTIKV